MARLTAKARNALPSSDFGGPGRSFPLDTANRARNALARSSQFHPELEAQIKAKVRHRYPSIAVEGEAAKSRVDRPRRHTST